MTIVIYQFAPRFSATHMANRFNVGESIIKKYVDIVCDVLTKKINCLINTSIFFQVNV